MNERRRQFAEIFRTVMRLDSRAELEQITQAQLARWDSLRHAELLILMQQKLGVRFNVQDAVALNSVRAIYQFLDKKTGDGAR